MLGEKGKMGWAGLGKHSSGEPSAKNEMLAMFMIVLGGDIFQNLDRNREQCD